ncbi:MAG: TetR/AcrR family transcriptional regulator [Bacteroidales bacterium]|nr:TetR/AcrR family transcriptional regulator [Bacteroidales bacterium]
MARQRRKKYEQILETARQLFWKHGYRRVTVEEICREAETSKMTFYRYFSNKLELAKAVFDAVAEKGMHDFKAVLYSDASPSEKLENMLRLKLEGTNEISNEFVSDFHNNDDLGLKQYIEEKTQAFLKEVIEDIRIAQQKGWFRKDMKPEFFLYMSQKSIELMNDEYLKSLYNTPQEIIMEIVNFYLYGIAPKDKK